MSEKDLIYEGLVMELRRGTLVLSVLAQLKDKKYGYSLVQDLRSGGLEIDQSTLYPLLRRLEKQGLLLSDWSLEEARPRRYYMMSEEGKGVYEKLKTAWNQMVDVMKDLLI